MNSEMTVKLAAAIGKTPEETAKMLEKNPKLSKLLSDLNEQDAQRLMAVLSNKESINRILATPQAKSLIEGMNKQKKQ